MAHKDPFCSSVNVSERQQSLKTFNLDQCYHALVYTPCLQESIRKALIKKIRRLEEAKPEVTATDLSGEAPAKYKTTPAGTCGHYILDQDGGFAALVYDDNLAELIPALLNREAGK